MLESPQDDNGYDISDYRRIYEEYGTMEDYEESVSYTHLVEHKTPEIIHKDLIGSPIHLKRLLMNILSNAVKYNKD